MVGPSGLLLGGPQLTGGQAGTEGLGYTAELLLPDAEIRGHASGFHAAVEISAHDVCFTYAPANRRGFGPA